MVGNEVFRALCLKVADEQDPKKIELLKQQMRILLQEEQDATDSNTRLIRRPTKYRNQK